MKWEVISLRPESSAITFILANGLSTFFGAQILSGYDGVSAYQVNGGVNWEF